LKSVKSTVNVTIFDELNNTVFNKIVPVVGNNATFPVNVQPYGPGKFTLTVDGAQELVFYADNQLIGKSVFGIIEMFRSSSVPLINRFTDINNDVVEKTYTLKIDKRKTFWKYYIVLKYSPKTVPTDLSVAYPDQLVTFARQGVKLLSDGTSAVPFVSDTELAIQDEPVRSVQLQKANSNQQTIVLADHLPNPSITSLTPDVNDNKIYSEIYFYI
jgi:hypothetical protein